MAKSHESTGTKARKEQPRKIIQSTDPKPAVFSGGTSEWLNVDRLSAAQRTPLVEQMGQTIGNRGLQRVLSMNQDRADGSGEGTAGLHIQRIGPTGPAHPTIRYGSQGESVSEAQGKLNQAGANPPLAVDGIFGPLTRQAVMDFQRAQSIGIDGVVGPITWGHLDKVGTGGTGGTTGTGGEQSTVRWTDTYRGRLMMQASNTGPLNLFQYTRVEPRVNALSDADWTQFHSILENAASDMEFAFLCKALAAQRSIMDISKFADRIRGMSERWLMRNLMAVNLSTRMDPTTSDPEERGIMQQYGNSCGPTSVQLLHAQADPIYALELRSGGPIDVAAQQAASNPSSVTNTTLANEQRDILAGHAAAGTGFAASDRSKPGPGAWVESNMNAMSAATGLTYTNRMIGSGPNNISLDNALMVLYSCLSTGIQVPITVGGTAGQTAHYVVVIVNAGRRFLIHDVWSGDSVWRSEDDFRNSTLRLPSNWNMMTSIDVPTETAPPLPAPPAPTAG